MRKPFHFVLPLAIACLASPLAAQTVCPGANVIVNSPEDALMLKVNGADNPQDQVAALDQFIQSNADSKFIPCAYEYETMANVKLNQFDKAIEYGEKDLAANYKNVNLMVNLAKAYVGAVKITDTAFNVIMQAPDQIKAEASAASRPAGISDADWRKSQEAAKDDLAYMEYAFFNLLPRVSDAAKRVTLLGQFEKAYPDADAKQVNYQYYLAYTLANQSEKADAYGEKVIAADPNDAEVLNRVAFDYANRRINLDKAAQYAKKVTTLVPALKKPDGVADGQFKTDQNNMVGMAHLTMGYVDFQRAGKTRRVAPAIEEFKTASGLLGGNPQLKGGALFYLGSAYEFEFPPNHHAAAEALSQSAGIASPWQAQARTLLARVKAAK
ncbi:MAG TPA: hypothetical protein VGW33_09740 [Terriglobia bacterium]|nr:hypothetical protein [Terriglobia bacterium]